MKATRVHVGFCAVLVLALLIPAHPAGAQTSERGGRRGGRGATAGGTPPVSTFKTDVPAHPFDIVLARPTSNAVTISVLAGRNMEGRIRYAAGSGALTEQTPARSFTRDVPVEIVLSGLKPDTAYRYQFVSNIATGTPCAFHTQRAPGRPFVFTITADSHLDERTDPAVYQRTLSNALADAPDFHIDLGDTFMSEKHANQESALRQYLAQRYYFGLISRSAPLFLVLGNHDGEFPCGPGRDPEGLAGWSVAARQRYFPNPVPDGFYAGDAFRHAQAGLLQDYYAWTWGDALFVVLSPYWWTSRSRGNDDPWANTLGREQYDWLRRTLEQSHAKFKFVFIHQLTGGVDRQGRGGAEAAAFAEWGGRNPDGTEGLAARRPGWLEPVHALLVRTGVSIVFHGHDHLYARQELDGVVYQEVPQPGLEGRPNPHLAAEYGYGKGDRLGSPGHLRVKVGPLAATVEYIRSIPDSAVNGAVAHVYTVAPGCRP